MPHVVLHGDVNLDDLFTQFKGVFNRTDHVILKTGACYISRDKTAILIESLAIEKDGKTSFLALISRRDDGIVVRIYPGSDVEKTPGVKQILADIAQQLLTLSPQLIVGETNLSDYLH